MFLLLLSIPSTHNAAPSLTSNHYQNVTRTYLLEYTATPSRRPTPQYYTEEMSSHGSPSTPESCADDSSFIENNNQLTILKTFYEGIGSKTSKSHL